MYPCLPNLAVVGLMEMNMERGIFKIRSTNLQLPSHGHELQINNSERTQAISKRYLLHLNVIIETGLH